jgi:hypothetical protein
MIARARSLAAAMSKIVVLPIVVQICLPDFFR